MREAVLVLMRCVVAYYTGDEGKAQALKNLTEAHRMLSFEERFAEYGDEWYRKGLLAGEAAGEARGIAVGEARGEARGIALSLAFMLEERFGALPLSCREKINSLSSGDLLKLLPSVKGFSSLEAFEASLSQFFH